VVFDWNGTLVDDADRALAATNHVLAGFGLDPLDAAAFGARFKLPMRRFFTELGIPDHEQSAALAAWNRRLMQGATSLQPGAAELLARLRALGIPAGVVSAAAEAAVRADAAALGVAPLLAFVAGSVADKPAALAEIAGRVPGRMIYVGDTEYDMEAARAAGAIALGLGRGYRPAAALALAGAAAVLDDFLALTRALQR
jgi:phosphoglycolate phosphatase-like HAD superfamily hydrolase